MNILEKKAYIFDMDGTIYSLHLMHKMMLTKIIKTIITRPSCWREIFAVYKFRKYKEVYSDLLMEQIFTKVAKDMGKSDVWVQNVIIKWMFDIPIRYIEKCANDNVVKFINDMNSKGKIICVYSDYPVEDKIKALRLNVNYFFSTGDKNISETKPSKKAMINILNEIDVSAEEILYVGDRDEKDGKSAELVGVDYMDIRKFLEVIPR